MKRLALLLALSVAACGGASQSTPPAGAPSAAAAMKAPGEATIGDHTRCPISGDDFVVTASSPKADYNGKTYYFCCPGCDKKFLANPQKYAVPAAPTGA